MPNVARINIAAKSFCRIGPWSQSTFFLGRLFRFPEIELRRTDIVAVVAAAGGTEVAVVVAVVGSVPVDVLETGCEKLEAVT